MGSAQLVAAELWLQREQGVGDNVSLLACEHPNSFSSAQLAHLMQIADGRACLDELPLPQVDFEVINW